MAEHVISNREIAETLERVADLLEVQDANRYRVAAYRAAARTIRQHRQPLSEILSQGGVEAVETLPTIGRTIAAHVAELVRRNALTLLERLEGEVSPEHLLTTVPGIGPKLAARIHHDLCVDTLEDLEAAAHDERLEQLAGFGPRRVRAIQQELASILGRSARHRARRRDWLDSFRKTPSNGHLLPSPDVATLLDVDADYRKRASEGRLHHITPRRFNPEHKAWLPILHTMRNDWHLTALFSNTARAHELERTRDWVVVYYAHDGDEGQCTVVTETHGPLAGIRVVRGQEADCRVYYASAAARTSASPARPRGGVKPAGERGTKVAD